MTLCKSNWAVQNFNSKIDYTDYVTDGFALKNLDSVVGVALNGVLIYSGVSGEY